MHWAAALGRTEIIKILYKESADINAVNEVIIKPYILLCIHFHLSDIELIAIIMNLSQAKEIPLDLARRGHHDAAVALLKNYAAVSF